MCALSDDKVVYKDGDKDNFHYNQSRRKIFKYGLEGGGFSLLSFYILFVILIRFRGIVHDTILFDRCCDSQM